MDTYQVLDAINNLISLSFEYRINIEAVQIQYLKDLREVIL